MEGRGEGVRSEMEGRIEGRGEGVRSEMEGRWKWQVGEREEERREEEGEE